MKSTKSTKKRKKRHEFSKLARRKNPGNTSPFSHLIDQHYESLGIKKMWDDRRVRRLVMFMRITNRDLASLVNMPYNIFNQMLANGNISGPAALFLTVIENQVMKEYTKDTVNIWEFPWLT
jgi:hypothetical protein